MKYGLTETTPPTSQPISIDDAKCQSRIDDEADDALIGAYIIASRRYLERVMCRSFVTTTWTMTMDFFPRIIETPRSPLASVVSIKYDDENGDEQTLATSVYTVDTTREPGRIVEASGESWPSVDDEINAVRVEFTAGYGTPATVPETIKQAIRLLTAHYYENRESSTDKPLTEIPRSINDLIWIDRILEVQ